MGDSYSNFIAGAQYQLGVLDDSEFVRYTDTTWAQTLVALGAFGKDGSTAGLKAIRVDCPTCVPISPSRTNLVGGHLWVQYKGTHNYDAGYGRLATKYQDKVYVHLLRRQDSVNYGKGSELWASLAEGESYADR